MMRVIKIAKNSISARTLAEAVRVLRNGGVVAYPTDTAYGLAADPANAFAMKRIFAIKGREKGKPLPLIAGSLGQARTFSRLDRPSLALAKKYWPGPLTIVAPRKKGRATVAVRVPASAAARAIASALGRPITSTSANLSGTAALYTGRAVAKAFKGRAEQPDLLLDAGRLPRRPVSTIVRLRRGKIELLRQGAVAL